MPTYTYKCKKCSHEMDVFHAMSASPKVKCDACNSTRMERLLGSGAGIIFKGSGFYETDYKGDKGKKDGKPKKDTAGKASADGKSDTSSEKKDSTAKPDSASKKKPGGSKSTEAA